MKSPDYLTELTEREKYVPGTIVPGKLYVMRRHWKFWVKKASRFILILLVALVITAACLVAADYYSATALPAHTTLVLVGIYGIVLIVCVFGILRSYVYWKIRPLFCDLDAGVLGVIENGSYPLLIFHSSPNTNMVWHITFIDDTPSLWEAWFFRRSSTLTFRTSSGKEFRFPDVVDAYRIKAIVQEQNPKA